MDPPRAETLPLPPNLIDIQSEAGGKLLFDAHAFPLRIAEVAGQPFKGVLQVGYADSLFTKSKGGSGLGLAISKSLVDLHNGSLSIASAVGAGTTVTVDLRTTPTAENSKAA